MSRKWRISEPRTHPGMNGGASSVAKGFVGAGRWRQNGVARSMKGGGVGGEQDFVILDLGEAQAPSAVWWVCFSVVMEVYERSRGQKRTGCKRTSAVQLWVSHEDLSATFHFYSCYPGLRFGIFSTIEQGRFYMTQDRTRSW